MDLKKRTQLHYVINLIVLLITTLLLTGFLSSNFYPDLDRGAASGITFGISFGVILTTYFISTIVLSTNKEKPLKIALPLFISVLIISLTTTLIEWFYFWNTLWDSTKSITVSAYILFSIITISFLVLLPTFQVYTTKFLMSSLSSGRGEELIINKFLNLTFSKSNLIHRKDFSYIYSKKKIFVIKFISESEIERDISLELEENEPVNKDVKAILNKVYKIDKNLNTNSLGYIVYLSNKLPNINGEKIKKINIIKMEELFREYKRNSDENNIDIKKMKELI